MKILSENVVADFSLVGLIISCIIIAGFALIPMLIEDVSTLGCILIPALVSVSFFCIMFFSGTTEKKREVKAIITDMSGYQEIIENWKIKEMDGEIFILEEKD